MKMTEPIDQPATALRGTLRLNESMARHVTWRAGGTAARAYSPADMADLVAFVRTLPAAEPVQFVGLGSNLLVRDGGYRGTVVLLHNTRASVRMEAELLYAEAGLAAPKVARFAGTHGREGAEFLAGIPGTVGGALAMNAGCYGSETWDIVAKVTTLSRAGDLRERGRDGFRVGYRHVDLPGARLGEDEWFVAAWFALRAGDGQRSRAHVKHLLGRRIATQPLGLPNAGSVFRNPPGDHAARLIEASGLKGYAVGGARVSEKHANFIVNPEGRARASDIEAVIEHARAEVKRRHGIDLVPEVRIIGEPA
jgi:UDP-N-acetylmuramate dehydrogenase